MVFLALIEAQGARNEQDLGLLMKVVKGDEGALGELYDRYASVIFTIALRIVKREEEAEDLVQETFLQVWNKSSMFEGSKGSVYTWVTTIARRKAIDRLRSKSAVHAGTTVDEEAYVRIPDPAFHSNPLNAAISAEYEDLIKQGLALLSDEQRDIIDLSYFDGYTQSQIAEKLQIPLGTVKTRMRTGMINLRDFLKERIG